MRYSTLEHIITAETPNLKKKCYVVTSFWKVSKQGQLLHQQPVTSRKMPVCHALADSYPVITEVVLAAEGAVPPLSLPADVDAVAVGQHGAPRLPVAGVLQDAAVVPAAAHGQ